MVFLWFGWMHLAAVDIGGTKICVCVGNEKGEIYASEKILTQPLQGWQNGLKKTAELLKSLCEKQNVDLSQIAAIGISSPGPISSKEGKMLKPPNLPGWENAPLIDYFQKAFRKPVQMNNDANAAALAEREFGFFKGIENLVYLTCSTGMGGGAIVNGELVQGASDTAAEVGHFVLDINGPPCPCGQKGCFEEYCGGAALARKMEREIREGKIETEISKGKIDPIGLIAAVRNKDPYALRVWSEFLVRLAQGVGIVLMTFNPEVVILGTIAIHSGALLFEPLRKLLPHFAWKENIAACKIEASSLGEKTSELSGLALAKRANLRG